MKAAEKEKFMYKKYFILLVGFVLVILSYLFCTKVDMILFVCTKAGLSFLVRKRK